MAKQIIGALFVELLYALISLKNYNFLEYVGSL